MTRWPVSDDDHVGVLPEAAAQGGAEGFGMGVDFALGDLAVGGDKNVFDRVFQRDDMVVAVLVDFLDHGGKGGRFAAPDRPGHKHQAVVILGEDLELLGQPEFVHGADLGVDDAENGIETLALLDDTGAEAGEARHIVTEVKALVFFQHLQLHGVEKAVDQRLRVGRCKQGRVVVEGLKGAVTAHQGRRTDAHVNVGSTRLKTETQKFGGAQAVRQVAVGVRFRGGFGMNAGLFHGSVGLNGGDFHGGDRGSQGLAQALSLSGADDRLFEQKIDGRKMGHRLKRRRRRMKLFVGEPPGVVGGGKNVLVILGSHGRCVEEP